MDANEKAKMWSQLSDEERRAYNRGRMQKLTGNSDPTARLSSLATISPMQHVLAPLKTELPLRASRLISEPPSRVHPGPGFRDFEKAHPAIAVWWKASKEPLAASLRDACMRYGGTLTPKQLELAYRLAKDADRRKLPKRKKGARRKGNLKQVEPSQDSAVAEAMINDRASNPLPPTD